MEDYNKIQLSSQSQLALMTTSNGKGFHTYSAYLTEDNGSIIAIRNISFKLLLSYPDELNPYKLLLGMHLDYYGNYYERAVNDKKNKIYVDDSLKSIISKTIGHYRTLQRIIEENTGSPYITILETAKKEIDNPAFFFDRYFIPYFVNRNDKIERKLRAKKTIQRILSVDNHAIVAHFVEQFKKPFDIGNKKWDIHAMDYNQHNYANFVINEKNAGLNYIMKQTPQLESSISPSSLTLLYKEKTPIIKYIINPVLPEMKSNEEFTLKNWKAPLTLKNNQLALNIFAFHSDKFVTSLFVIDFKSMKPQILDQPIIIERKKIEKKEQPIQKRSPAFKLGKSSVQSSLTFEGHKKENATIIGNKRKDADNLITTTTNKKRKMD